MCPFILSIGRLIQRPWQCSQRTAFALKVGLLTLACLAVNAIAPQAQAQPTTHLEPERSQISRNWSGEITLSLSLSAPQPYRLRLTQIEGEPQLHMEIRGLAPITAQELEQIDRPGALLALRYQSLSGQWGRLILPLPRQMAITNASFIRAQSELRITVSPVPAAPDHTTLPDGEGKEAPAEVTTAADTLPGNQHATEGAPPLVIVLDPGHGGYDPGASYGALREKDLVLQFAHELRDALLAYEGVHVQLTREKDRYVSLLGRRSLARQSGADIFLSLHADALEEGEARGVTFYTLSQHGQTAEAAQLARQHHRDDLLYGVDLNAADDEIWEILSDLSRHQSQERSEALTQELNQQLAADGLRLHHNAQQSADFAVLKSPDMVAVLIEIGFLSNAQDRAKITDEAWRQRLARSIAQGVAAFATQMR